MKDVGKSTYSSDMTWSWNVRKDNGAFELFFFMVAVISFCYLSSKRKNW